MTEVTQKRTALVTGGSGFVGSHLVTRLAHEGWEVHVIVRPSSHVATISGIDGRVTIHRHDGSTDGMISIVRKSRPDVVFHLASLFLASHSPVHVVPMLQSNVVLATQLFEAMTAHGVHRLINTGTSWQHYRNRRYSPVCLYAATKQACESILAYYTEATPLRAITLVLFDTYGPCDPRKKIFSLLRSAAGSETPLRLSPGKQLLDLVYIDDVVKAYCLAADRLLAGKVKGHETFSVSSGKPITLRKVVRVYGQLTGKNVHVQWGGAPYRPREMMTPWRGRTTLPGWKPEIPIDVGIRKMEHDPVRE